jgi:hypothetical protein
MRNKSQTSRFQLEATQKVVNFDHLGKLSIFGTRATSHLKAKQFIRKILGKFLSL